MKHYYQAYKQYISALTGKKRAALSFVYGMCATLALPPLFLLPFLFPAFVGLYLLLTCAVNGRQAFRDGWWWGFGFFITGTYWIAVSLTIDIAKFGWLIPFCVFGLSGFFALYIGILGWLTHRFKQSGLMGIWIFAAGWWAVEIARGTAFTGFPWNPIGVSWSFLPAAIQIASITGTYGLGFLTVLVFTSPVLFLENKHKQCVALLFACTVWIGWGAWRLEQNPTTYTPNIKLRIVQANIPQSLKWNPEQQLHTIQTYMDMTRAEGSASITHVIWPETAFPLSLTQESDWPAILSRVIPRHGALLTGALHVEGEADDFRIWNSLQVLNDKGIITAVYDKHHLVPFGEFVPFRSVLPLDKITPGSEDFSRGPGPSTLAIPGAGNISPLICYEAIFPWEAVNKHHRPDWLLNITNDGWFGISSGPYQHMHMVQMRAVEQGLPLVRAASGGISMVADGMGRIVAQLPLNEKGNLDSFLPIAHTKSIYSRYSEWLILLLVVIPLILNKFMRWRG